MDRIKSINVFSSRYRINYIGKPFWDKQDRAVFVCGSLGSGKIVYVGGSIRLDRSSTGCSKVPKNLDTANIAEIETNKRFPDTKRVLEKK